MAYYFLTTSTLSPCYLIKQDYARAAETWCCKGCKLPRIGCGEIDVSLQEAPQNIPLNIIMGVGVGIIQDEFLDALGHSIARQYLFLGRVYGPDGKLIERFMTFRGKQTLIIRGNEKSSYRKCEVCGRDIYFAMGKKYLLGDIPSGIPIFGSLSNQLIVNEDVYQKIKNIKWKSLFIYKLGNSNFKFDGKGDFLTVVPG